MCVSVWIVCACVSAGACRGQKRALGPLELELQAQAVVSHGRWELNSSHLQMAESSLQPTNKPIFNNSIDRL